MKTPAFVFLAPLLHRQGETITEQLPPPGLAAPVLPHGALHPLFGTTLLPLPNPPVTVPSRLPLTQPVLSPQGTSVPLTTVGPKGRGPLRRTLSVCYGSTWEASYGQGTDLSVRDSPAYGGICWAATTAWARAHLAEILNHSDRQLREFRAQLAQHRTSDLVRRQLRYGK